MHRIILQEANYPRERLDWLVENHLQPLIDEVHKAIAGMQEIGIVPAGSPALLFNMIRVCAGGLVALKLELKQTSDIDLDSDEQIAELADLIIRVFFPGEQPQPD